MSCKKVGKKLTNRCKDCIFRVQFQQVGAENHVMNICCSEQTKEAGEDGEEMLEISRIDADKCLNYSQEM